MPVDDFRVRTRLVALFIAGTATVAVLAPAGAAETRQQKKERQAAIAAQLRTLREQVSEASEEEALLLDRLDEVKAQRRQLDNRIAQLDRQLIVASAEADSADALLEEMQGDFVRTQTQLALATDQLAVQRGILRDRAVSAYMGGRPTTTPTQIVLNARSLREVAATIGYQEAVVHAQRRAVDRFSAERDATASLRVVLEAKKDAAKAQRDIVIARRAHLEALRSEQDQVRQDVRAQEAQQKSLADEAQARVAEFEAQIAELRAESGTIRTFLRDLQAGQSLPSGGKGLLSSPISSSRLSSDFGPRVHPVIGTARMHDGVDFAAPTGTPIRAAAGGTVVFAGPRGGYGITLIVDHGNSLATLYAHQSRMFVTEGAVVTAGQVIGAVGSTGMSTGSHLHFETRVAGVPVNPLLYL